MSFGIKFVPVSYFKFLTFFFFNDTATTEIYTFPTRRSSDLGRALLLDLRARRWVAGGSTISQQTAKIVYTNQQRTVSRKLTELIDAAGLEKSLTKREILQLYLNRIYLGSAAYGVDGAARVYFGTSARQLTLAQAAMLATLTRAPSVFSPRRDLLRAQQRA